MELVRLIHRLVCTALACSAQCADTNTLVIKKSDERPGARFFVDECLTRGLTNSISLSDLRTWATNTIEVYRRREAADSNAEERRHDKVGDEDVPDSIKDMPKRTPSCRILRPSTIVDADWEELVAAFSKVGTIPASEAEDRLLTMVADRGPPAIGFYRSSQGVIEAVTIRWYLYGVLVGGPSFTPDWKPWYQRKLADGVYLWHGGYK